MAAAFVAATAPAPHVQAPASSLCPPSALPPAIAGSSSSSSSGQRRASVALLLCAAAAVVRKGHRSSRRKQFTRVRAAKEATNFHVGASVKVVGDGISFWHMPGQKGKPGNPLGLEGVVVSIIEDEHLTANRPILVKLTKAASETTGKFKAFNAHFSADELGLCEVDEDVEAISSNESSGESTASTAAVAETPEVSASSIKVEDDRWAINLLYDGDCPSCMKQVEFLRKRMDENPEYEGLVRLTNLQSPDYDPEAHGGIVFEDGMRHIHAITREGEVITGMDVFRRIYSIVGMQWVYDVTTLPVVGAFFDWLYDWFSEYRLRAAGREDILESVHNHQLKIQELSTTECEVECEVDWDNLEYTVRP
eukprot:TRINITY_DN13599_c0_g1_i1.p1 TRINITY_DN13599_c0_g1~~TRINITY_DN13599_c0_g1_i1.p1  ORF type:complete len:373 (+),score=60.19 TRINITY_DN13599_c0_g1_i1:26-1120(+)